MIIMSIPLTLNELLWSTGQTAFLHAYSTRGDSALAALNISGAISQLVFVTFGGIATAVAVLVGNTLGKKRIRRSERKCEETHCIFSLFCSHSRFCVIYFKFLHSKHL